MIELLNLALAGGIAAAAAPVIIHIAHRRRLKPIEWGAMRFLQTMLQRRRRSLSIENLLLLIIRILALVCLALALMRPNFSYTAGSLGGDVISRGAKTAAVLLIDDSVSSGEGRTMPAIDGVKKLALAYLDTLKTGDEVSIIPLSRLRAPPADPLYDLDAARQQVKELRPTALSSDMPALMEAGITQLARHLNPEVELVLVTDGRGDGWKSDDRVRWEDLRRRLSGGKDAVDGSRARPHLVLLAPEVDAIDGNLAVTAMAVDRALIPANRTVEVRISVAHTGTRAISGTLVRLLVNGRTVAERSLELKVGERRDLTFSHVFGDPGSYVLEGVVEGARDPLAADDHRALAVQVESTVPVLLVEGVSGTGLDGSLGLVAAALDPLGDGKDLFSITRIPVGLLDDRALVGKRVAILGDVPALDAAGVAAIEHFVVAGGGVLMGVGPQTPVELANRFWTRGGDGFLPALLRPAVDRSPAVHPVVSQIGHQALSAFTAGGDAWAEVNIRRHLPLDVGPITDLTRILTLDGGEPLLVERMRGLGRVALMGTSLDGSWSDLPLKPAFVPLIRGLMASLGGVVLPPRNLAPGQRLAWVPPEGSGDANVTAEGPDGLAVPLDSGAWEGRRALLSAPLVQPGTYQVRVGTPPSVIRYAVALGAEESALLPLNPLEVRNALGDLTLHRVERPARVAPLFAQGGTTSFELARWLVIACLTLLFIETILTRRMIAGERAAATDSVMKVAA
ncbi:MAG: BatA domain-containing protein [Planctomycetes bacterium]|nr:BatA domain-containing protein [Planctomycetota bacterium]